MKISTLALLSLGFLLGGSALSQSSPDAGPPPAGDAEVAELHNGLRALQQVMETALNSGDIDTILANVDDRVVFTTMNDDVVHGKDGIRQYFEKMMRGPDKIVESVTSDFIPDALSLLYGTDMAIAYGHTNDHYVLTTRGSFDLNARWSATMIRRDGKWLVANFHYSANIFDNPIVNMQRRILIAAGAGVAVLAAGIAFWFGRRRVA